MLTLCIGPVATSAKNEAAATKAEFSDLAGARQTPDYKANDTELTHYHSFFYTLLSVSTLPPSCQSPH